MERERNEDVPAHGLEGIDRTFSYFFIGGISGARPEDLQDFEFACTQIGFIVLPHDGEFRKVYRIAPLAYGFDNGSMQVALAKLYLRCPDLTVLSGGAVES